MPKDPNQTLDRVRGGTLRAGISANPPWTAINGGKFSGIEVTLIQRFANSLDARVEWTPGTESALLEALSQGTLDIVVAGLTADTPWKRKVALTRDYAQSEIMVAVLPGVRFNGEIDGERIGYRPQYPAISGAIAAKGGIPVPISKPESADIPVAMSSVDAPEWSTARRLATMSRRKHVVAVSPGENRFLVRLEQFLSSHRKLTEELTSDTTERGE